ncbi:AI-2E family transporter [Spirochaetia bacterium]|nr:AI-2E family transporter [Spirochaetia bacterium]
MSDPISSRPRIQDIVFAVLLVLLFILVCRLFSPFFTVLLWSILLYVLVGPLFSRLTKKMNFTTMGGKILQNILAGVFSLGTIILILIPLSFVGSQFFRQIMELIRYLRNFISNDPDMIYNNLTHFSEWIGDLSSGLIVIDAAAIQRSVLQLLNTNLQRILSISTGIAQNVGTFAIGMVFMMFCLFFFYMDGAYLSRLFLHIFPIRKEYISALVGKFKEITRNLFLGYIMVALVQAVMAYIIFSIFHIPGTLVFASLVMICSFIPMVGAGLVWMPLGVGIIIGGDMVRGIVFLLVSGVFISLSDNFLRPIFLQNRIQLHPLIIFVSILGGVRALGFNGLVLGPMIVILFLTVLDLFLTEHKIDVE